jgi:hypothetical protein
VDARLRGQDGSNQPKHYRVLSAGLYGQLPSSLDTD